MVDQAERKCKEVRDGPVCLPLSTLRDNLSPLKSHNTSLLFSYCLGDSLVAMDFTDCIHRLRPICVQISYYYIYYYICSD